MSWDDIFLNIASMLSTKSKYNGSHIGCVLVKDKRILSIGINGYASSVDDSFFNNLPREDRLKYAIHAEENALLNAAKFGTVVEGATAYVTHHPCASCASKLRQSGISEIVYRDDETMTEDFRKFWIDKNIEMLGVDIRGVK